MLYAYLRILLNWLQGNTDGHSSDIFFNEPLHSTIKYLIDFIYDNYTAGSYSLE